MKLRKSLLSSYVAPRPRFSHIISEFKRETQTLKTSKSTQALCPPHIPPLLVTMSLTPWSSIIPMFFLLVVGFIVPLRVTAVNSSLLEVLRSHGLPAGLFPQGVKSYNLDQTGGLEVHLDRPCLAQYETTVFFDSVVRANLSFGQLKVLEGMSREELFLWLPVKDIIVTDPSSGLILIDIGLAYKHLSLSRFEDPPICRSHGLSLRMGGRKGIGFKDQR